MANAWMDLVKKMSAENKGKSLGEILKMAKVVYRGMKKNSTAGNKAISKTFSKRGGKNARKTMRKR
jgi:hypothetical protein